MYFVLVPEDLDGKPIEAESPNAQPPSSSSPVAKFFKSKWEAVDETELEAQGIDRFSCCIVCCVVCAANINSDRAMLDL